MGLLGTAAKLLASLDLDTKPFERGEKRVNSSLGKMDGSLQKVSVRTIAAGTAIGRTVSRLAEKGVDVLFDSLRAGEQGLRVLQDTQAQTAAVIESTGGKAGITAAKVRELAEAQEDLTTVDDKTIQSGENMLLTFTNIGKDVFPQATKAMVDMAVAMNGGNAEGIDLKTTAIQIGKALNDPIKGATALRKVGVALTEQQEDQIKKFVKAGEIEKAQGVILAELSKEFGKAGEAAGKSGAAGVRRLADAVEDTQITLATGLSPALNRIRGKLATALNDPKTQAAVQHLGEWLGDAAEKGLEFAQKIPWGQVAEGVKTAAGFAGKLVDVFVHMPPAAQGTILALAGLNKLSGGAVTGIVGELGKGLIKGVLGMTAGVVNIKAGTVSGAGGAGGGGGIAGALGMGVATAVVIEGVREGVNLFGDFAKVLEAGQKGDAAGITDALRGAMDATILVPQTLRDVGKWIIDQIDANQPDPSNPIPVVPQGLSPDERQAINDDRARDNKALSKYDRLRERMEANRIATVTSKTAIVSSGHSDRNAIVTAIQKNRPVVKIDVRVNQTTIRKSYTTSSQIGRTSGPTDLDH